MSDFITGGIVPPSSRYTHTRPEHQTSFRMSDRRDERIQRAKERVKQQRKTNQQGADQ